jgi:hypothetical protein
MWQILLEVRPLWIVDQQMNVLLPSFIQSAWKLLLNPQVSLYLTVKPLRVMNRSVIPEGTAGVLAEQRDEVVPDFHGMNRPVV